MGFIADLIDRLFGGGITRRTSATMGASFQPTRGPSLSSPTDLYATLEAFRDQNNLYKNLAGAHFESGWADESLVPIRNVANRAVEVYSSTLWPGSLPDALPVETEHDALLDPIQQVFTWSAFGTQKQVLARQAATLGDGFLKVVQRADKSRVYMQLIHPRYVTDFDVDERNFLTYARIDVPVTVRDENATGEEGALRSMTETEVWTKNLYSFWRHEQGAQASVFRLGTPDAEYPLADLGIDFVPLVHIKHRDTGELRGAGVFTHALSKLIEADRVATRLHQMLFRHNKPLWAVGANAVNAAGQPMPAPKFADATGAVTGDLKMNDDTVLYLPGMATMASLIPNVNYAASLEVLNAMMREIEADIPELAFYRLRDFGSQLSGYAVRLLLSDAIARIEEARGNAESGLIRALQMALTLGKNAGLFPGIGTYEAGELDFHFKDRPVVPLSDLEAAQSVVLVKDIVGEEESLRELGKSPDDIKRIVREKNAAADTAFVRQQSVIAQQPPVQPPNSAS